MSMRSFVRTIANIWNEVGQIARSLAEGSNWSLFFKVFANLNLLFFVTISASLLFYQLTVSVHELSVSLHL